MQRMQDYIKMNGKVIHQPDTGLGYSFETTYTEDSTRVQSGRAYTTPMFTVESLSYYATWITAARMSEILQIIEPGHPFKLHYFSPYYGCWRDDEFYVGKGTLSIGYLNADDEVFDKLSFNLIGVNPVDPSKR